MKREPAPARARIARDGRIARAIAAWFGASARPLPWRITPRDPYLSLVSEFMLQQTQVGRVLERWPAFIGRFPSVRALARAAESEVLAAWSGMGYYARARRLHAAARAIVMRFGGRVPPDAPALRTLPGVGRYTAGAIASIVFNQPEPIVDGNVARVLLRLDGRVLDAPRASRWAWRRAGELVRSAAMTRGARPAAVNEGLMELGAVVCTPRRPGCARCPVRRDCVARARGLQDRIPRRTPGPARGTLFCSVVVARDTRSRLLVERRGDGGLWAGLWQAPTLERRDAAASRAEVERWIGLRVEPAGCFTHATTHRTVLFESWRPRTSLSPTRADAVLRSRPGAAFLPRTRIARLALSSPQRRVLLGT